MMLTRKILLCLFAGTALSVNAYATSVSDLERQIRASEQARIQMQQQLEDVSSELNMVNGRLEEANNTIRELQQNQQDLYRQLDELKSRVDSSPSKEVNNNKSTDTVPDSKVTEKPAPADSSGDKAAYQKAVALIMNDHNYKAAQKAFREFIKKYPGSQLASNAYFWLGESSLKLNDITGAKQNFLVVIKDDKSNKRAEALYKLGVISLQEKKPDYAGKFFTLVLRDYPGTTTAKLAQNELNKLK